MALSVLRRLISRPHLGLRPVAVVADQIADREIDGISVFKSEDLGQIASSGVRHAIVAAPELSQSEFAEMIERAGDAFPHLILIPNTDFIWKIGSYTRDLMGILGIQVRNNLLDRGSQIAKRTIDLAISTLLTAFPASANGNHFAFDRHGVRVSRVLLPEKIGPRGHGPFMMWKFRTMAQNSAAAP